MSTAWDAEATEVDRLLTPVDIRDADVIAGGPEPAAPVRANSTIESAWSLKLIDAFSPHST